MPGRHRNVDADIVALIDVLPTLVDVLGVIHGLPDLRDSSGNEADACDEVLGLADNLQDRSR